MPLARLSRSWSKAFAASRCSAGVAGDLAAEPKRQQRAELVGADFRAGSGTGSVASWGVNWRSANLRCRAPHSSSLRIVDACHPIHRSGSGIDETSSWPHGDRQLQRQRVHRTFAAKLNS